MKIKISELLTYQAHPLRAQMGRLPINKISDLEDGDPLIDDFSVMVESVRLNGIKEPLVVCSRQIVDGFNRLKAASDVLAGDSELPVCEISEDEVFPRLITSMMHVRRLTKAQSLFAIYPILRADHLAFISYSERKMKYGIKGENVSLVPVGTRVLDETKYFARYIENSDLCKHDERPNDWFARVLGVPRKYLVYLNEIWNYLEDEESIPQRELLMIQIRELVYVNGIPLNRVVSAIEGALAEREDLKPGQKEIYLKKWVAKCKSSAKGFAEKFNNEDVIKSDETRKELYEALKLAGFKMDTLEFLSGSFSKLLREEKSKFSQISA